MCDIDLCRLTRERSVKLYMVMEILQLSVMMIMMAMMMMMMMMMMVMMMMMMIVIYDDNYNVDNDDHAKLLSLFV